MKPGSVSLLILSGLASLSHADTGNPVRLLRKLDRPVAEEVVRVQGAQVLLADYPLIERDFPQFKGKAATPEGRHEIDQWLLDNTAYVSARQAAQSQVNSPIPVERDANGLNRTRVAYRPHYYGRALVYEVDGGLIDAKGVGRGGELNGQQLSPEPGGHKNGLASVAESLREFIFEKKVGEIFRHSGSSFKTVGTYAVIDYGFDIKWPDGNTSPAGAVLRQAHLRRTKSTKSFKSHNTFIERGPTKEVESILRHYGMTAAGEDYKTKGFRGEAIDLQGNDHGEIFDFGSYLVKDQFQEPAYWYPDRKNSQHAPLLAPQQDGFVQPDSATRLPSNVWGYSVTQKMDPKYDNIMIWSDELSRNIRAGKATARDAQNHYEQMMKLGALNPAQAGWWAQSSCLAHTLPKLLGK
ncbi:MAG: hypothetical protein JST16_14965 [Bdellovibrionales bacterium]|nr:hypothetical protein [Bdellovibrionales bacterium]